MIYSVQYNSLYHSFMCKCIHNYWCVFPCLNPFTRLIHFVNIVDIIPFQMLPRRVFRYPPGRNIPEVPMPGAPGGMLSPYDMGSLPIREAAISQPIPTGTLATALANATPEQQRTVCAHK